MNLLHVLIIVPLLSFLYLIFFQQKLNKSKIVSISFGTLFLLIMILVFLYIDYYSNTYPDTLLIYTLKLWDWFDFVGTNTEISLQIDEISLFFISIITSFYFFIYLFTFYYYNSKENLQLYCSIGFLLISSLYLYILAGNLLVLLLGSEMISFCTFLLINTFYKKSKINIKAIKVFIVMVIADYFLLHSIFLIYHELGDFNIREIIEQSHENLAFDSNVIFLITFSLFVSAIGKTGLFPFHIGFVQTNKTQFPVMILLQSITSIVVSGYLIIRFSPLFIMSSEIFDLVATITCFSVIFSGFISLVRNDIKSIITFINLVQISFTFYYFSIRQWDLLLNYIIYYSVISCIIIMVSATLVKFYNGQQNIYKFKDLLLRFPLLFCTFCFILISLSLLPHLFTDYTLKSELLIEFITKKQFEYAIVYILGLIITIMSFFRLTANIFKKNGTFTSTKIKASSMIITTIIVMTYILNKLEFSLQNTSSLKNFNFQFLSLPVFTLPITITAFILSYLFFIKKESQLQKIINLNTAKVISRFWYHQWYFDNVLNLIFVSPFKYVSKLFKRDLFSKWDITLINCFINLYKRLENKLLIYSKRYQNPLITICIIIIIFVLFI